MELKEIGVRNRQEPGRIKQISDAIARHSEALKYSAVGAFLGLSWACGLRAWMVLLALEFGETPSFSWVDTFVVILFSAATMGGILGGAEYARRNVGSKRWRWAALAPLTMVIYPALFMDGFIPILLTTGGGGGAISVSLGGIFGGYALAGQRRWLRLLTGLLFLATVLGTVIVLHFIGIFEGLTPTASQTFGALFFTQLMIILAYGVSIPFRHHVQP